MPKVLLCLGNPGDSFQKNRHNIGFEVGKAFLKENSAQKLGKKFKSTLYQVTLGAHTVFVQFPDTYMNLSGEAIQPLMAYYKIPLSDLLVVYDDFDIPFGQLRLREKGSPGTHNGMKSVTQSLQSSAFPRLRFGIGPLPENRKVADFVLENFNAQETPELPGLISKCVLGIDHIMRDSFDKAMRDVNLNQKKSIQESSSEVR